MLMTKIKRKGQQVKKDRPAILAKMAQVEEIAKKVSSSKVVALVDVRNLPDRLLQSARKKLRGKAEFMLAKNSVIKRALEKSKKADKLIPHIKTPTVIILTDMTPYSLFKFFKDNRAKVAAKPGQVAPFDIIVHEGETDLPPGPALSELKGAQINAQIKGGKIVVAKDSVVAKAGAKINPLVCKALQKLNVLPFETGLSMIAASEEGEVYLAEILNIDEAGLRTDLLGSMHQALNVSINACYPTPANIDILLQNAMQQGRNLALNGKLYSDATIELLLAEAVRQGSSLGPVASAPAAQAAPAPEAAAPAQ
jgi:large subunit ribosomal protein L10